jgi:single-strand DNA-binding protein
MLSLNRHEVIGHLGLDPELKYTDANRPYAKLSLCTNRRWKDANGKVHEKPQWHRIIIWGQRAEFAAKFLRKGAYVRVVGESETNEYTDADGVKRWATQINAREIDFLEPRGADPDDVANDPAAPAGGEPGQGESDIPF